MTNPDNDPQLLRQAESILSSVDPKDSPEQAKALADYFLEQKAFRLAASALDRAWGLDSNDDELTDLRRQLLESLSVVEHGIRFQYIPAGSFLMGSDSGEPDERPVHAVRLGGYWLSETPITWATYVDLMGWTGLPMPSPPEESDDQRRDFYLQQENKIRLQYCESETTRAVDWHTHASAHVQTNDPASEKGDSQAIFSKPPRDNPDRPFRYDRKPMVAIGWQGAEELCQVISNAQVQYRLPTEAEWEKGARGGLIGQRYAWGSNPPDHSLCDFNHFGDWSIRDPMSLPPNDYGIYSMCGGVWEWTADSYQPYCDESRLAANFNQLERVLRGGSWADCADAVTVSFRMPRGSTSWREKQWGGHFSPNIGFRICRVEIA